MKQRTYSAEQLAYLQTKAHFEELKAAAMDIMGECTNDTDEGIDAYIERAMGLGYSCACQCHAHSDTQMVANFRRFLEQMSKLGVSLSDLGELRSTNRCSESQEAAYRKQFGL